jgi:hypothetical protein
LSRIKAQRRGGTVSDYVEIWGIVAARPTQWFMHEVTVSFAGGSAPDSPNQRQPFLVMNAQTFGADELNWNTESSR